MLFPSSCLECKLDVWSGSGHFETMRQPTNTKNDGSISGLLSHGKVGAAEQAASLRSAHPAGRGRGFGVYPAPARLSTRNCPTLGLRGSVGPAPARPSHVRVLGAGHNVRLELGVVEGRGGADQPPVLLAAGVDLELRQAAGQLVARQSAPHLRAGRRGGQGVWAV